MRTNNDWNTTMQLAIQRGSKFGSYACLDVLLQHSSGDVNAADKDGRTALHDAVALGSLELVTKLLAAGADPTVVDAAKQSPLALATNPDIASVLAREAAVLKAKADAVPADPLGNRRSKTPCFPYNDRYSCSFPKCKFSHHCSICGVGVHHAATDHDNSEMAAGGDVGVSGEEDTGQT
jgi:hypothetical protein